MSLPPTLVFDAPTVKEAVDFILSKHAITSDPTGAEIDCPAVESAAFALPQRTSPPAGDSVPREVLEGRALEWRAVFAVERQSSGVVIAAVAAMLPGDVSGGLDNKRAGGDAIGVVPLERWDVDAFEMPRFG